MKNPAGAAGGVVSGGSVSEYEGDDGADDDNEPHDINDAVHCSILLDPH
jgi:hypothetical protein